MREDLEELYELSVKCDQEPKNSWEEIKVEYMQIEIPQSYRRVNLENTNHSKESKKDSNNDIFMSRSPEKNQKDLFSLENDGYDILNDDSIFSEKVRGKYLNIMNNRFKRIHDFDRLKSIERYKKKKLRRRHVCQIKYKVRQELACKRLRVKGKFVKAETPEKDL